MGRKVLAAPGADLLARDVGACDHRGRDDFAARSGRFTVDLHLAHALDLQEHLFDLARIHLLAGRVDQLTGAAGDGDLAAVAKLDQIVGHEAPALERLEGRRVVQIAERDIRRREP